MMLDARFAVTDGRPVFVCLMYDKGKESRRNPGVLS